MDEEGNSGWTIMVLMAVILAAIGFFAVLGWVLLTSGPVMLSKWAIVKLNSMAP